MWLNIISRLGGNYISAVCWTLHSKRCLQKVLLRALVDWINCGFWTAFSTRRLHANAPASLQVNKTGEAWIFGYNHPLLSYRLAGWRVWLTGMLTFSIRNQWGTPVRRYLLILGLATEEVFPVSYLTSPLSEEDIISTDRQNGHVVSCKVCAC